MVILSCRGIKKSFGEVDVLKGINLDIKVNARMGLVGRNGAGKTTLANLIFGNLQQGEGTIVKFREQIKMAYLLQNSDFSVNLPSETEARQDISEVRDYLKIASNLGLQKVYQWDSERTQGMSGGEKAKIALANIWTFQPDLLILDEPTNHLDFQGIEWLVDALKSYDGAILVISHDRYFLDQVATEIVEIDEGVANVYGGNYSFYRDEKKRQRESRLQQYYIQQKQEAKIEAEIQRIKLWSAKAHREAGKKGKMLEVRIGIKEFYRAKAKKMDKRVKSRLKHLERLKTDGIEKPKEDAKVSFALDNASKHGRRLIEGQNITKGYASRVLFADSNFFIQRGDKIGLFGANGCGKTTLLKIILGQEKPDQGEIWLSPSVKLAYLSQESADLCRDKTPLEFLDIPHHQKAAAHTLLANLGFDASMLQKQIRQFSLGEITRLRIAGLILAENNLLILDEPTNHLDLPSREQLEDTLTDYDGTLIIVSHDRYLLEKVCYKMLIFENGSIKKFEGGFKHYQDSLKNKNLSPSLSTVSDLEEKMIIDNKLAALLGKLSTLGPGQSGYAEADREFRSLVMRKQELDRRR